MAHDQCFVSPNCRWCEKACWTIREHEGQERHLFWIERARSGQATCTRGCGELIAKGLLRVGVPINDSRGCNGIINAWCHLECLLLAETIKRNGPVQPERDLYGWAALTIDEKKAVEAELAKEDREADKPLDPNDPAFLPQRALPRVKPPPNIVMKLLPYQEEGFGWMRLRERGDDSVAGGILADEMGECCDCICN